MPYKEGKKWRGVVRFTPSAGRQMRRTQLFDKKKDATVWENETRKALIQADRQHQKDLSTVGRALTVGEWGERYMDFAESTMCHSSYCEKQVALRRLIQHLPNREKTLVGELSTALVLDCLTKVFREKTGNTANKDRKNLCAGWNWGVRYLGMDRVNPFQLVDKFPEKRQPRYVPPLDDFRRVLDFVGPRERKLLLVTYHTAARKNELWRLQWEEVDFDGDMIGLWTRKRRSGNDEFDLIPMSKAFRALMAEWRLASGGSGFVFDDAFDDLKDPNNRWLKRACDEVGVRRFGFHGIRHLSASIAVHNGANLLEVQQLLRHKSVATTQGYVHRVARTTGAVDALDAALSKQSGERKGNRHGLFGKAAGS